MNSASMQYWAWRAATAAVCRLPEGAAYRLGGTIGNVGWWVWPRGRRSMVRNYGRVFPDASPEEIRAIARRSLVNYCHYLVEFLRFGELSQEQVVELVEGDDAYAQLRAELDEGHGAVVALMHFGNWDTGAAATVGRGFPVSVLAETFADERLDRMVLGTRERVGMRVLKVERSGPSLLRTLQRGEVLAVLIDRPGAEGGVSVDFFGGQVTVPSGVARMALRTGSKLVPAAFARRGGARPDVIAMADYSIPVQTGGGEDEVRALTQAVMAAHERFIRERPDQWYMFREMWPAEQEGS